MSPSPEAIFCCKKKHETNLERDATSSLLSESTVSAFISVVLLVLLDYSDVRC